MTEIKDPIEARVSRLGNYLIRAYKYKKASILFALYLSEYVRADVEREIKKLLSEQGLKAISVDAGEHKDLPSFFASSNSDQTVFIVHNMEKGFPDSLRYLNFKREDIIDHQVKALFWVTDKELTRIGNEAPDFFAFRNRVVEFIEVPMAEERRPALVEFALETEFKSLDEIKHSIELKETLLSELSEADEISGYLLNSLGILFFQLSSYKKAIEYHEQALVIAKEMGDRRVVGTSLGNLGSTYSSLGQVERAIEYYKQALAISQEIGDRRGEGTALGNLGLAYGNLGQVEKAIEYHELALAISQELGDKRLEGAALGNLGLAYRNLGEVEKAIEYHEQALAISQEFGDRRVEGISLGSLGNAYSHLGQVEKAIEYYEQALVIAKEIGDRHNEGIWLGNIGLAYSDQRQVEKAIEYYEQALVIAREIGDRQGEGNRLVSLGNAYSLLGQVEKAIDYYEQALVIGKEIKDPRIINFCEENLKSIKS
ncbi:MAG: tetratricopeptide repeat protein [Methanosarcinales archaeon]|nr:tetratricopeptide repeat protein [Methanosarcinales archaeon]